MSNRILAANITALQQRISQLHQQTVADRRHSTTEDEQRKLVEQLQFTLRELSIAEEELHYKDEALIRTRKIVEAERDHYRKFFDLASDGCVISDIAGTVREVNRAATSLLQCEASLLLGTSFVEFFPPTEQVAVLSRLMRLRATRQTETWETSLNPHEGQPFTMNLSVSVKEERAGEGEVFTTVGA